MKAQVFYEPLKMTLEDVAEPAIAPHEVLVRVKACGICGSDVAYYYGDSSLETPDGKGPCILGHEFTGEVVEVGDVPRSLGLFAPGDRVVLDPVQYCNACEVCKTGHPNLCENKTVLGVSTNGGFAEFAASNYTGVHKLPESVSFEEGAFAEPTACAVYAVGKLGVTPGDFVVIVGPGPIGLIMLQLVKAAGAGTVALVGTRDYRLELGKKLGADVVLNTGSKPSPYYAPDVKAKVEELTRGKFANGAICATSSLAAMELCMDVTGRASTIVFFGLRGDKDRLPVPVLNSILWDKTIRFSWLAPNTWPIALNAIATGLVNVKALTSAKHRLPDLIPAIHSVKERKGDPLKDLVIP